MDALTVYFLHCFDLFMNLVTFFKWSEWQGSKVPEVKVKEIRNG